MRRKLLLFLSLCPHIFGQAGPQSVITTVAGTDWLFPGDGRRAIDAPLGGSLLGGFGVAVDTEGNYYIADGDNNMIMKVAPDGILRVVGGNGVLAHSGDNGPATTAALAFAKAAAFDRVGDLYVITGLGYIRKITKNGIITTIAGNGDVSFNGDNRAPLDTAFYNPNDLAIDSSGAIYVADTYNHRIRKVANGTVTTIAGTGVAGYNGDGIPATQAQLALPNGIAIDSANNIVISDFSNERVRVITPDGIINTLAYNLLPTAVEVSAADVLYIGDAQRNSVFATTSTGFVRVAGNGVDANPGYTGDGGPATSARLNYPSSIAVDAASNIYIADLENNRIRKVSSNGIIQTVAGNGQFRNSGEGGPATSATIYFPQGSAVDGQGNLYISEPYRNRVRKISGGILTTFAGTGKPGSGGDNGPAAQADLFWPTSLTYDPATTSILITDQRNNRIRRVSANGIITTVAGNGQFGYSGDGGPALQASLRLPNDAKVYAGEIYIADSGNDLAETPAGQRGGRIRKVDTHGRITTIAGTGSYYPTGDGGPAVQAGLSNPSGLAIDAQGNIYFSDRDNNRIRKIDRNGIITTVAGTGAEGNTGDNGPALSAALDSPSGMAFTPTGDLFFSDQGNNRIRCLTLSVNRNIIAVAGSGEAGYAGDGGLAINAKLAVPMSLAIDPVGNAFIADFANHRIRQLKATPPAFRIEPDRLSFKGNARAASPPAQTLRLFSGVPNVPFTVTFTTESGGNWLSVDPTAGAMPTSVDVTVNPQNLTSGVFRGTVTFSAPLASPPVLAIPIEFQVEPALPPNIKAQPESLTFSFTQGGAAAAQTITVTNQGSGSVNLTAGATTNSGGNWLGVTPASITVSASTPGIPLNIRANPTSLGAGTYLGQIVLTGAPDIRVTVPITMTVNPAPQRLVVSPVGLTFVGVQGGGVVPPQSFTILNTGSGTLTWRARVTDASGGTRWLSVSAESGSTAATFTGSQVEVRANPAGLGPGDYYGQIEITSPEAVNSPQFISVFFGILAPGSDPGPIVQPTGLVFRNTQRGSPSSQEIRISNLSSRPITFRSAKAVVGNRNWFIHVPTDATITPDQPARIIVQPQAAGLPTGVYEGSLTLLFGDNTSRTVSLLMVNTPPGGVSAAGARGADGCQPKKLLPVLTSLGLQSSVLAGWPNPVVAEVVDDCGDPLKDGSVVTEFSNTDPPVLLTSSNDGKWSGIWQIRTPNTSQVTVRVKAARPDISIEGTAEMTAAVRQSGDVPPVVAGVGSAASGLLRPPAPGGFIAIVGARLGDQTVVAPGVPFPTEIGGTSVSIGSQRLPIYFTSDGQVNAVIPYGLAPNTTHQLVVRRSGRIGAPEPITIAPAQPAVFMKDPATRRGAILNGQGVEVTPGNPIRRGDVAQIFCEGLGAVNPPVPAGTAAPLSPLSQTTETVTVTIGGQPATVFFAGLAPGAAGLYQVNAMVPQGISPGNTEIVIRVGGQESPPVTMPVQ